MATVTSGRVFLTFGQIYVESGGERADFDDSFRGQHNGLCGASIPGTLCLITGLHTGWVGLTVEVHDDAPPLEEAWEEVVEASFRPEGYPSLAGLDSSDRWYLDLERTDYRVRYCGFGMDAAYQDRPDVEEDEDTPPVDRYLLQFWPAPPAPDRVIKQTSQRAAYWHSNRRKLAPPQTPEEQAGADHRREEWKAEELRARELEAWGGSLPSERIRATDSGFQLVKFDRPLLDDLDHADDDTLAAVARWSIRQACISGELDRLEWVAAALDRLDQGVDDSELFRPPPGTFGTDGSLLIASFPGWDTSKSKPIQALLIFGHVHDEPLEAALTTLWMAIGAYGEWRGAEVVAKLRAAFPQLDQADGARPQR